MASLTVAASNQLVPGKLTALGVAGLDIQRLSLCGRAEFYSKQAGLVLE